MGERMSSNSFIIEYFVRFVYFVVFLFITSLISMGLLYASVYFSIYVYDIQDFVKFIPMITGLPLTIYSWWLAKESAIAFSDYNCYFLEAIIVSVKKTGMFISLIPIVGRFFESENK